MSAGTSEFFCLICLLVCSCTAQKIIPAELGQDVILPCKVPNINNINDIAAVEWIRPGLDPEYVLLYRDGRFDPYNQHPSYQNRVDLQDKEMKNGDISLILKNVTMEDTGKYVCRVSKKGKIEPFSIINLKVYLSALEKITAELGQDVILPCKVPNINNINDITAVAWIRPDQDPEYVLLYRDGHLDPINQHPSYQNRVDLQDKEMKDGDVSLILKNVKKEDTGRYECQVFEKGKNELISITYLEVHPPDVPLKDQPSNTSTIVAWTVVVIILLILAFVLFYRKRKKEKKEKQEDIERGNNPEIINPLQQQEQENEDLKNEVEKLKRGHSEIITLLQQQEQKNEALMNRLKKLEENNSETSNQLQQEKERNEKAESDMKTLQDQLEELKRGHSETISKLQQVKQENEDLKNEMDKLERSHSETSNQLQQEKQRNEKAESDMKTLQDQLEELKRGHLETSSKLQQVKQENEDLKNEMDKLERSHLETISKLQEEKQDLKNKLKKPKGNNPETINQLQKKKQKNKAPKNEMDKEEQMEPYL